MKLETIAVYCICDDYLKQANLTAWHNEKMTSAEVMTTLIVSNQLFGGNL